MTSKERVRCALLHREADRVPLGELAIHSPISSKILGRDALSGEGGMVRKTRLQMVMEGKRDEYVQRYQRDNLETYLTLGLDLMVAELNIPKHSSVEYRDVTDTTWTMVDHAAGTWAKFQLSPEEDVVFERDSSQKAGGCDALADYADYLSRHPYQIDDSEFESMRYYRETAKDLFLVGKVPNLYPIGTSWFSDFLELMYVDPDAAHQIVDYYTDRGLKIAEKFIELGADAILNSGDWAYNTGPLMSPACVREFLIPPVSKLAQLCHSKGVFLFKHTDGNVMPIADDFFGMGIDVFQALEPHAGMDLAECKRLYGDRITFMGNVDCATILQFGTREEIVEDTLRCLREGAAGGGLILSSSNSIHSAIPTENYLIMLETARKYGNYPISLP